MARLGDYVKIRTGKLDANASSSDGEYPFFTCAVEPLRINKYSYDCECVLVAGNGDLNVKYYNGKFDAYQRTYIIESLDKSVLDTTYLYKFLDKYVETLRKDSIGGVIKYIKLGNLTEADIPLPDLHTQRRIAATLDKVSEGIAVCRQMLADLDVMVKSQFVEMFGDPVDNPMGWPMMPLGECIDSIGNGKSFVCESHQREGNFPAVLKLSAATSGTYRPDENKAVMEESDFVDAAEVHDGDLLFTRKNTPELVGMAAYVFSTPPKLMMPDIIFRLNTDEQRCKKIYLWQLINHDVFRPNIQALANGSAKSMSNISKDKLEKLMIPVPDMVVQERFIDFLVQADKSKFVVQQQLAELETLKKSLMQEYFG